MKAITIYVHNLGQQDASLIDAIKAAINSPDYQLGYELTILETDSKPAAQSEWVSYSQIAGKSLLFYYISDQQIEELNVSDAKKLCDELQFFSFEFRNFLYHEMKCVDLFPKVFNESFLQNTLIPMEKKIKKKIEKSEEATHQALEEMKQSSEARVRNQKNLIDNSNNTSHSLSNLNTIFAPKNNYFKKAAAEFCIGTILCGTGALLFTIEPISASILIVLGLLLYAATLYHVAKGFSEQENQSLKLA